MLKTSIFLFCILWGHWLCAQKFSFVSEVGLLTSQVDGDGLQGYSKKGLKAGIGVNYPLLESLVLAIDGAFHLHGSRRSSSYKLVVNKLANTTELDLSSLGLSLSFMYKPDSKSYFFGAGLVHHRIFNYQLDVIEYRDPKEGAREIVPETIASSYNAFKVFAGYRIGANFRLSVAFERAMSNIMKVSIDDINVLSPYSLTYSLSYEINPSKKKKNKRTRKKKVRS